MMAPPLVETARLVLSTPTVDDAEAIFGRYASDDEVTRYLAWRRHRTIADTMDFLAFSAAQWARTGAGPYLICSRGDGQLLGSTGLDLESGGRAMTGYVLAKDAWGRGYATEAVRGVVEVARDMGLRHLRALCHPQHLLSQRVLWKCGFASDPGWDRLVEFPNLAPGVKQAVLCYGRSLESGGGRIGRQTEGTHG